jgi:hypothetical protein
MSKLDRIIEIIRENMVANAPGQSGGFSSNSPSEGPTAGFDPKTELGMFRRTIGGLVDKRSKQYNKKYEAWLKSMGLL